MNTKEKIEVMQAWLDKRQIQFRREEDEIWVDHRIDFEPDWDFAGCEYRIKPQDPIDKAYDRMMGNAQFNRVEVDYESFKLGWEARGEQ